MREEQAHSQACIKRACLADADSGGELQVQTMLSPFATPPLLPVAVAAAVDAAAGGLGLLSND